MLHLTLPDGSASWGPAWRSRLLCLQDQCHSWRLWVLWVRKKRHLYNFGNILPFLGMKYSHALKILFFFYTIVLSLRILMLWKEDFLSAILRRWCVYLLTSFSQLLRLLKMELDLDCASAVGEKVAGGWQVQAVLPAAGQRLPRVAVGKALDK